jgi:uncharacterized membrane protein YhaH (DUF805 family)
MPIANCPYCKKKLSLPKESGDYDCPKCSNEFFWDGSKPLIYENKLPLYKFPMSLLGSLDLPVADFSDEDDADTWWANMAKLGFLMVLAPFLLMPFTVIGGILGFLIGIVSSTFGAIVAGLFTLVGFLIFLYYLIIIFISSLSAHFRRSNAIGMSGFFTLIIVLIPVINFVGIPLMMYKFGWQKNQYH